MKTSLWFRILFLAAALILGVAVSQAEDLGAVKARMDQRQSTVDALKERKLVGENNRGYLEARASLKPEEEKIVSDENADRATVYAAIAAQTGSTSDQVGRLRATKIAASTRGGVWVQSPQGDWAVK
jgi:uncharacterized protein YdbL (DUF1318 family)